MDQPFMLHPEDLLVMIVEKALQCLGVETLLQHLPNVAFMPLHVADHDEILLPKPSSVKKQPVLQR